MKSEITIFTMTGTNYGSVLQAYALQYAIKNQFHAKCHTVFIKNNSTLRSFVRKYISTKKKQTMLQKLNLFRADLKNRKRFEYIHSFYRTYLDIREYSSTLEVEKGESESSVILCGSDQIWNPQFVPSSPHSITSVFFGNVKTSPGVKKFSYAASIAVDSISPWLNDYYINNLSCFHGISVREKTGADVLRSLTKRNDIRVDLDPVFLIRTKQWLELASSRFQSQKFIFLYMLRPQIELLNYACDMGKKLGVKIVYMGDAYYARKNVDTIVDGSVQDFLSAILYADLVITNSFHATAFSVIFKKKFISAVIERTGSRVSDLLETINLTDRILHYNKSYEEYDREIEYANVKDVLNPIISDSLQYVETIANASKGETQCF